MTFRIRPLLLSPDNDAGASGVPADPQAPEAGSMADAMHFADDEAPPDGEQPADDGSEPPPEDAPDDEQVGEEQQGEDPAAPTAAAAPAAKPAPKPDPVSELAASLKARDEAQERRYAEFMARQEKAEEERVNAARASQAAAAKQRRRESFEAQLRSAAPKRPPDGAPVEMHLEWQEQFGDYVQRAAEARANFIMQEKMEEHLHAQEERIRSVEERTRAAEHQAEARAAELAVDRDLAVIKSMPEMAWIKNPEVEREFFGYWNALLQTSGQPVSGIDAARRFMRMFTAVVPHVRQQARNTAQQQGARPSAPAPAARPRTAAPPSPAPRGAARSSAPAQNHWTSDIKF